MPKKGNNIYLRKDGCLEGQYLREKTNDSIRCGYTFGKTFEDVESRISENTTCALKFSATSGASFENLSIEWLITQKPQLKISSVAKYTNILTSYLIPRYGIMPLASITRREVMLYSRELLVTGGVKSNGLSPKTVNSILSVMKNIFAYAEKKKTPCS